MKNLLSILLAAQIPLAFAQIGDTPYTIAHNLGITPPNTNFIDLPAPIKKMVQATVMYKVNYEDGTVSKCTGVAIAKNEVLTAAHCFDYKGNGTLSKVRSIDIKSNPVSETFTPNASITKFAKGGTTITSYNIKQLVNDYVIITIPNLNKSNFVASKDIVTDISPYVTKVQNATTKLADIYEFDKKNTIYLLGSQADINGGCVDMNSNYCQFQWQSIKTDDKKTGSANDSGGILSPSKTEENRVYNLFVSEKFKLEHGDSGGPEFICDNTACKLFGINKGISNEIMVGVPTRWMIFN